MKKPIKLQSELYARSFEEADEIIHHLMENYIVVIITGLCKDNEGEKPYRIDIYMEVIN